MNQQVVFLLSTLFLSVVQPFPHTPRQPIPRHAITTKLNAMHLHEHFKQIDTVEVAEMDEDWVEEPQWMHPDTNTTDNVWFPFPQSINDTDIPTIIADANKTLSMIQDLMDSIAQALDGKNITSFGFAFITRVQLPPLACPADATRLFDQALRAVNPDLIVSNKAIRSGSVLCDDDCPCSTTSRRKMATTPLEIRTVSTSNILHMPSKQAFPMEYESITSS